MDFKVTLFLSSSVILVLHFLRQNFSCCKIVTLVKLEEL